MLIGYQLGLVWLQMKVKLNLRKVGFIGSYNWKFTCPAGEGLPAVSSGSESPTFSFSLLPVAFFRACVWWQNGWLQSSTRTFSWVQGGERGEKKSVSPFLNSPIHPRLQLRARPGPGASQSVGPSISDTQVGPTWTSCLSVLEGMELWTPSGIGVGDREGVNWSKTVIVTKLRWH